MSEEEESAINLENLQWAMNQKKWSPTKLAQKSGVNKSAFTLLSKGESKGISAINVKKMARALEVTTDFLLGLTTNPYQNPAMDLAIAEIVAIAKTLSEFRQRDLLLMAQVYRDADVLTSEIMLSILEDVEEAAGKGVRDKLAASLGLLSAARDTGQGSAS